MAQSTNIAWADGTWNPVRGCTKISPGCTHCYAEKLSARNPDVLGEWGPDGVRVVGNEAYWRRPVQYAHAHLRAVQRGEVPAEPYRLFTASLADIFEDHPVVEGVRERIWGETLPALDKLRLPDGRPALVLLALTKRARIARDWYDAHGCPDTVWPGVTVEDQERADERIPIMLGLPRLWLSMEPLLEAVDLDPSWCAFCETNEHVRHEEPAQPWCWECDREAGSPGWLGYDGVQWIIVGGESGPRARPMHAEWVWSLRDQCQSAGVPFFFKQWGEWAPAVLDDDTDLTGMHIWRTWKGPEGDACSGGAEASRRVGKHAAGRILDGREWSEVPRG